MSLGDRAALPLVFIGPMAAGKSKIGRRVARGLGVPFIDTDQRIVAQHGPIEQIFTRDGEERFREIEREVVAAALEEQAVVSLGGGAVLDVDTQAELAGASVVYVTVSAAAVAERLAGTDRPLVAGDGVAAWERIFTARRPIYERLATLTIDSSRTPMMRLVDDVVAWHKEEQR
ncbi:shikimate kinase [Agromyces atrinae]|uniref:shikimate kinase n=1 Tax=Agromyces atrinae TaxID=592376 RepID=UPI001F56C272|nr:shikimate kinase [Agromyces atrinae]MCI2958879.1 shikimate kinase [Agromyces atrinae]